MKKFIIILMIVFLSTEPVYALGGALSTVQLEKIALTLKLKLTETIKLVKDATIQSKTIIEMRELAINMKRNYDFVRNFRMETYIKYFKDELRGITLLDNLEGKDWEKQFDLVMREIDNRFTTEEEKTNAKNFMSDLKKLYALQEVKANENVAIAEGKQNQANNVATTAVNTGLLLISASKQEQRALIEDQQKVKTSEVYKESFKDAQKVMGTPSKKDE